MKVQLEMTDDDLRELTLIVENDAEGELLALWHNGGGPIEVTAKFDISEFVERMYLKRGNLGSSTSREKAS